MVRKTRSDTFNGDLSDKTENDTTKNNINQEKGKFNRRDFFKVTGLAALGAISLKLIPGTLLDNRVMASDPGCASCFPGEGNCGCDCGPWYDPVTECGVALSCNPCEFNRLDRVWKIEMWLNETPNGCCVSKCYPTYFYDYCGDPDCPTCYK